MEVFALRREDVLSSRGSFVDDASLRLPGREDVRRELYVQVSAVGPARAFALAGSEEPLDDRLAGSGIAQAGERRVLHRPQP